MKISCHYTTLNAACLRARDLGSVDWESSHSFWPGLFGLKNFPSRASRGGFLQCFDLLII